MLNVPPIEWVGYLASALIVVSLTMSSIVKLRIINSLGCAMFVIYGASVGALPVAISNALIILINLYYLYKLSREKRDIALRE